MSHRTGVGGCEEELRIRGESHRSVIGASEGEISTMRSMYVAIRVGWFLLLPLITLHNIFSLWESVVAAIDRPSSGGQMLGLVYLRGISWVPKQGI